MTKELQDRLIGILRRICSRAFSITDDVTQAGGILVAGASWDRCGEVRRMLESRAREYRELAKLCDAAAELIDEPSEGRAA